MQKTTKTSIALWLGRARSSAVLQSALVVRYSADGDSLGSAFGRAFKLKYDDDFREAERTRAAAKSLDGLLKGISYETEAIPALTRAGAELRVGENCFVCLYDFKPAKDIRASWTSPGLSLRFVAWAAFMRPATDVSRWMGTDST